CSKPAPPAAAGPTPSARIVYIVVTATPAAQRAPDYRATVAAAAPSVTSSTGYVVPAAAPAPIVAPRPTTAPAERLNCTIEDFVTRPPDSAGSIWFDGEVKNLGSGPARVRVLVKAYSINGVLLDSRTTYADRDNIPPGERSHFNGYVKSSTGQDVY